MSKKSKEYGQFLSKLKEWVCSRTPNKVFCRCTGDIIINSDRKLRSREELKQNRLFTRFFGIYSMSNEKTFEVSDKRKIQFDNQLGIWVVGIPEEEGLRPFWFLNRSDTCNSNNTSTEKYPRETMLPGKITGSFILEEKVYHDLEIQCPDSTNNLESCGEEEHLCYDRRQCIPSYWTCDGITDCSEGSDECPLLDYLKISNDVRATPKLSVIVKFYIDSQLFDNCDCSNTPKNLTVLMPDIEEHLCYFKDSEGCGSNNTELHFTQLRPANSYTFTVQFCTEELCFNKTVKHETSNFNCGPEDDYKIISTSQICDDTVDCPKGRWDEQEIICKGSPFVRNIRKVQRKKIVFIAKFLFL